MSFDKALSVKLVQGQEIWRAFGTLVVQDENWKNTFHVLVSGPTEQSVQQFIETQEENCDISLDITAYPDTLSVPHTPIETSGQSFILNVAGIQLHLDVIPCEIQTPQPYHIAYNLALTNLFMSDADTIQKVEAAAEQFNLAHFSMGQLNPDEVTKGKPWDQKVNFEASAARVQCRVINGEIGTLCLREKGGIERKTEAPIIDNTEVGLPDNDKDNYLRAIRTKQWEVEVIGGRAPKSKFVLTIHKIK